MVFLNTTPTSVSVPMGVWMLKQGVVGCIVGRLVSQGCGNRLCFITNKKPWSEVSGVGYQDFFSAPPQTNSFALQRSGLSHWWKNLPL